MTGPEDSERPPASDQQPPPPPPGHFLSPELESDCARFLEDVRSLVQRREAEVARAGQGL